MDFPEESFDVILSSLAFHYVADYENLIKKIYRMLKAGGNLVFTVEHPVFTAHGTQDWYYNEKGIVRVRMFGGIKMTEIKEQLSQLNKMSNKSEALYHKVAFSIGISDSSLGVLYTLLDAEAPCSQYDLCSEWSIPKQTINTAVAALQKKGVAFLSPIPGTRNKKNIAFTEFGRDFAEKTVGILRMAELDALAELSPEERELYIRLNEKYNCRLIEKLYRIMDEVNQDRKDCD